MPTNADRIRASGGGVVTTGCRLTGCQRSLARVFAERIEKDLWSSSAAAARFVQ